MKPIGVVVSLTALTLLGPAARSDAQSASSPPPPGPSPLEREVHVTVHRGSPAEGQALWLPGGGSLDFVTMPLAVAGEPVAGAPYSAEAVTEVVQTLADGNRIVRQSKVALFRDGKGRTRREQGLAVLGNFVGGADAERTQVQIHDPDAGTMYVLDSRRREARRLPAPRVQLTWTQEPHDTLFETVQIDRMGERRHTAIARRIAPATAGTRLPDKTERLGSRTIEGVEAEGTRTTATIPAGQIGNEQPIQIVSERWYSPDLKALVMSRHSDPRFGETTYRLTNIVRAEPAPDLFTVPEDFRIVEPKRELSDRPRLRRTPR